MSRRLSKASLIVVILVLVVTLVSVLTATTTYAVWVRNVNTDKELEIPLGDYNASLKYLKFKGLNAAGEFATTNITEYAVVGYDGLVADIIIPETYTVGEDDYPVTMIATDPDNLVYRFRDNGIITSLVVPDSVTEIKSFAFANCSSLEKVTIKGQSVITIGDSAFAYCTSLVAVIFEKEVNGTLNSVFMGTPYGG